MSTMFINQSCASALQKACVAYTSEIMAELGRRGILTTESLEAATALLNEMQVSAGKTKKAKAPKVKKPVVATPAHLIPYCGTVNEEWCCGARVNHGLYTQCTKVPQAGEDYCKVCQKQSDNSASGKPNGGDIRERVAQGVEWRDPKGKSPITFATLIAKPKFSALSIENAETECARFGWTIPESERVASATKRGRPKKVVEVSDTDSEDGDKPKRKRGRPKKQPAKKQELSELIKQQALAAVAELSDSDGEVPLAKVEAKPKAKKVKKAKAPKKPSQKALKAQAFREKLLKEIGELDSDSSTTAAAASCVTNAELRTFLKDAKLTKKAKDKAAKKAAAEALKLEKALAKEHDKAAKKEAADKVKAAKAAAKEQEKAAKKKAAELLKAAKAAAKEQEKAAKKEAADALKAEKAALKKAASEKLKAEKKAAKELEKTAKKEAADKLKAEKKAAKLAEVKAKIAKIEAPQLEEEDENLVLGELKLEDDEVAVEQALPFNITTGKCFKGDDAEYFAMCDDTSFPEPKPDEEGDICLYNAEGEMVATYEDGVVVPLDDEE